MHKCLKCGNKFDGKFCPECGTKWIDPELCPKCGARHEPDAKFCQECGARLDGKVGCPNCGAVIEKDTTFCAECGAKLGGKELSGDIANGEIAVAGSEDKNGKIKSYLAMGGVFCIIFAALMGLIFVFVSGFSVSTSAAGTRLGGTGKMLYYYFGDVYKEIDADLASLEYEYDGVKLGLYLPAVLGTVVSALGLLSVVCLSALTAFKAYKKFYKKEKANVIAPAVATYLVFATVATILLALTAFKLKISVSDTSSRYISVASQTNKVVFSDPTLAGLITGGIFLGIGVLLTVCVNNKLNDLKSVGVITAIAGSALAVVILALAALPAAGLKGNESYTSVKCLYSPFMIMRAMVLQIEDEEDIGKIVAYSAVCGIAGIALAVTAVISLYKKILGICEGKNKSRLAFGVYIVVLAVVYLIFSILMNNAIIDASLNANGLSGESAEEAKSMIDSSFTVPIVILVMAVLACVAEIAGRITGKKEELNTIAE